MKELQKSYNMNLSNFVRKDHLSITLVTFIVTRRGLGDFFVKLSVLKFTTTLAYY